MEIKVIKYDHFGNGIGKIDNKVYFIKRGLIGEIVDIKTINMKKNYANAVIEKVIIPSEWRINPICQYYDKCGGCNFLHTIKSEENSFKINKGQELLNNVDNFFETEEYNYRNKVTLHFQNNKFGFYDENTHRLVHISYCYLLSELINRVVKELDLYFKNNQCSIKSIVIKTNGQEIILDVNGNINNSFISHFDFIDTIINNDQIIKGKGYITIDINDYHFKVSAKSFFQVNKKGLEYISSIIESHLRKYPKGKILDLYSGTSVLGIIASKYGEKVISIESNESSIKDARDNIKANGITNLEIIHGKVEDHIHTLDDVDTIIIDPPRSGLDIKTCQYIDKIIPKHLIYVSCDMQTLKRDIKKLNNYKVEEINLIDMFPKTYHVECVCVLHRKNVENKDFYFSKKLKISNNL